MTAFIIVAAGGSYSDAYHNNQFVFLNKEDAEKFMETEKAAIEKINSLFKNCPEEPNAYGQFNWVVIFNKWRIAKETYFKNLNLQPELFEMLKRNSFNPLCTLDDWQIEEVELKPTSQFVKMLA